MSLKLNIDSIVSSSDLVRNFSKYASRSREGEDIVVIRNNEPDLVLVSFEKYKILKEISETLEYYEINESIKSRDESVDNKKELYSLSEVKQLFRDNSSEG